MASEKRPGPVIRSGLQKRLKSDLSKARTRGMSDPRVADLTDLLAIANLFAPALVSERERINALIEQAITSKYGTTASAKIARLAFGAEPETRGVGDPTPRYVAAYNVYLTIGSNKFISFTSRFLPDIGEGLAAQITNIYDEGEKRGWDAITFEPLTEPAEKVSPELEAPSPSPAAEPIMATEESDSETAAAGSSELPLDPDARSGQFEEPSFPSFLQRLRPHLGILFVMTAGMIGLGIVLYTYGVALGEHTATSSTPGRGTVIDARTGKAVPHPKVEPADASNSPQVGLLRFCDLTSGESCKLPIDATYYTEASPFVAKSGDIIEASFILYDHGDQPLPYFRLEVRAGRVQGQTQTEVENRIIWPAANGANVSYSPKRLALPKYGDNFQMVEARGAALTGIAYIPGSAELLNPRGEELAQLPDGIMGQRGVYMTDLGEPRNCLCEGGQYVREVKFRFKVLDESR